nr:hypothetical protein [Vibrio alginolyticus]
MYPQRFIYLIMRVWKAMVSVFKLNPHICIKGLMYLVEFFRD